MVLRPKITCGAIIKRGKKILLVKRNTTPYKNYWCLPGGHMEWKETAEEAVKREVKEETGLDIQPKFLKYYDEIIPEIKWHALAIIFGGKTSGTIKIDKKEIKDFKWFCKKEIKNTKIAFLNRDILKDYL